MALFRKSYQEELEFREELEAKIRLAHSWGLGRVGFGAWVENIGEDEYLEWSPIKRKALIGKQADRVLGLHAASFVVGGEFETNYRLLKERDIRRITREAIKSGKVKTKAEADYIVDRAETSQIWRCYLANQYPEVYTLDRLASGKVDKRKYQERKALITGVEPSYFEDEEKFEAYLREMEETKLHLPPHLEVTAPVYFSFNKKASASTREVDDLIEMNREIIDRIRYKNMWFVAPWGDQFSLKNNPELSDYKIRSITFYPHAESEGNLVVIEMTTKVPHKYSLIITPEGHFRHQDKLPLDLAGWLQATFENFVLKRLEFITRGAEDQAEAVKTKEEKEKEEREEIVRRSHYRVLTSTPDRKYTLMSWSARQHAQYVKENYGIDVYEETLRRKSEGALRENQVITFVRETIGWRDEPYQLVYREE